MIVQDTAIGAEFAGKPKRVTWERTWTYAGGPFTLQGWPAANIHTDPQFASNVGLSEVIVTGAQTQGYVVELLIDLFGERWLSHGTLYDMKFIKPILVNEVVQVHARVLSKDRHSSGLRYILQVWCEKQSGEEVLVGRASGWIELENA